MLMNASGNYKNNVTVESVLGRPLRSAVETAKNTIAGKATQDRLAEKDEARRNMNKRET